MKRKVLFVASLIVATATFAQDGLTSKKGEAILPEAGDWALGFDGASFVNYFGNLANGTTNNTMTMPWHSSNNTIYGKLYKDETTAYRALIRIGMGSSSSETTPFDANTDSSYVNTNKTSNGFTFIVGAGIEKRKGSTRLQGFYGAQALFGMIGGGSNSTDFGKELSNANTNFGLPRVTETKFGNTLTFGIQGFIGVEQFVLPKISLGAEYSWGFAFQSTGETEESSEYWGITPQEATLTPVPADHQVEETNVVAGKSSGFSLDTGNTGTASLKLLFHF